MWDAPGFRVYGLYTHFWPCPIITKLTLAFLTLHQHAKKSAHFINPPTWDTADFRVPWSKRPHPFLTTATQKQVATNMTGTQ